jgi:hypothetical protein
MTVPMMYMRSHISHSTYRCLGPGILSLYLHEGVFHESSMYPTNDCLSAMHTEQGKFTLVPLSECPPKVQEEHDRYFNAHFIKEHLAE